LCDVTLRKQEQIKKQKQENKIDQRKNNDTKNKNWTKIQISEFFSNATYHHFSVKMCSLF